MKLKHNAIVADLTTAVVFLTPLVAAAQCAPGGGGLLSGGGTFTTLLCNLGALINQAIALLGAIALLVFFWGLVKYIVKAGDEKAKEEGKNVMVWGIIALFVLFSVFGLVKFLQTAFGIRNSSETPLQPPRAFLGSFGGGGPVGDDDDTN